MQESDIQKIISEHPCFCEDAHRSFARMHIPVAPKCNIQCNYCNRRFDCCNESRPGVTSEVLSPLQAVDKISVVKERIPQLSVIGIAGPGDPLANEETFESLKLISDRFSDLTLCVSSNGLALVDSAQRLSDLGVKFITVTMNALDPEVGARIYDTVIFNGKKYSGVEGASILIKRQLEGITECVRLQMIVKVNIVMIPGINDTYIPDLVKKVKSLGVYIVNILPLIPVQGTKFSELRAPTPLERKQMMDLCELDSKVMRHCRQCRADAIGLLGEDRSSEFSGCGTLCESEHSPIPNVTIRIEEEKIAVATTDGKTVNSGFGNASQFWIFATDGDTCRYLETVKIDLTKSVSGEDHRQHIENIIEQLNGCGTIIAEEIGPLPTKMLSSLGIKIVLTDGDVNEAVRHSKS